MGGKARKRRACKSVGSAFEGSNPPLPISGIGNTVPLFLCPAVKVTVIGKCGLFATPLIYCNCTPNSSQIWNK
jgi:hypothetical protein